MRQPLPAQCLVLDVCLVSCSAQQHAHFALSPLSTYGRTLPGVCCAPRAGPEAGAARQAAAPAQRGRQRAPSPRHDPVPAGAPVHMLGTLRAWLAIQTLKRPNPSTEYTGITLPRWACLVVMRCWRMCLASPFAFLKALLSIAYVMSRQGMGQLKPACGVQVVVDLSRAAAIADMRPSRLAVIGGILQARPCSAGPGGAPSP